MLNKGGEPYKGYMYAEYRVISDSHFNGFQGAELFYISLKKTLFFIKDYLYYKMKNKKKQKNKKIGKSVC